MTDTNRNFFKVCRTVDEYVRDVIFKNNALIDQEKDTNTPKADVLASAEKIMD